jgi:hypothetical protein
MKRTARLLSLAAAPTFGVTALLKGILGASMLSEMVPMYAPMAIFNFAPWLELISRQGRKRGCHD